MRLQVNPGSQLIVGDAGKVMAFFANAGTRIDYNRDGSGVYVPVNLAPLDLRRLQCIDDIC